jgi:CheY-like chemotaxis protein
MKIFVVDDDVTARLLALDALRESGHELRELATGAALLEAATEGPDLILLDIEMPGMDGIAACRALCQEGLDPARVIFVSSHDDLETRLAAYDAGGSDYLVKPYAAQELVLKVRVAEAMLGQRADLAAQASYARDTAFTAMAAMGEMGSVLHFLRASFACREPEALARAMFDSLADLGLPGLVEIRLPDGRHDYSSQGACTPLEVSILGHAEGMGRIFQFRDRLVVNYPGLTLVVNRLPLDDPDRIGRLRDHLALMVEGASEKVLAQGHEQRRQQQAGMLQALAADLGQTLLSIDGRQAETRMRALQIDSDYLEELVRAFVHLGLTDAQENALAAMAEHTHLQLAHLLDEDHGISDHLRAVAEQLRQLGAGEVPAPD